METDIDVTKGRRIDEYLWSKYWICGYGPFCHFRKRSVVGMALWEYMEIWCAVMSMFCCTRSIFAVCQMFEGLICVRC